MARQIPIPNVPALPVVPVITTTSTTSLPVSGEVLNDQQRVRVEALRIAREVLAHRGFGATSACNPRDLIIVARFIETGVGVVMAADDE